MTWSLYRWVWQLEAPLHVGMPPAGALNRTRLYIPARAVWGALTAELARCQSSSFPDYPAVGGNLQTHARFSYLFPAEKVGERWNAWLPEYREEKGLVWVREDGKGPIDDRMFRRWLLATRPGTAIAPESDTAEEGSLREHEVINPVSRWGCKDPYPRPVGFVGYVFLSSSADKQLVHSLQSIERIFLGGDTRYGLGRLKRVECSPHSTFFGEQVDRQSSDPVVITSRILAHATTDAVFSGSLEYLVGWDAVSGGLKSSALAWTPGSRSKDSTPFRIREDGLWCGKAP